METCTSCGCRWDAEKGFYHHQGALLQPCIECRKDTSSIYYYENQDAILEARRKAYQDNLDAKRAYFRQYRAQQRRQLATA